MAADAYESYINSRAWAASPARLEELRRSGGRCRLCNRRCRLETHHRTYARLGHERASDLTTLCYDCHAFVTAALRERRYRRRALPAVTPVAPPMPRRLTDSLEGGPNAR
jgi:hypothetical protein